MDIDDFSDLRENSIDFSSPGTVSQQIRRFNTHFNKNPEKFPSRPLTEKHFKWLKSSSPGPSIPVDLGVTEDALFPEDLRNFEGVSVPLSDHIEMAIGVVPTAPQSSFVPVQRPRTPQNLTESIPSEPKVEAVRSSDSLLSQAQGSVPASEIQILDEQPEKVVDEPSLESEKTPEAPVPTPLKKKSGASSDLKDKGRSVKSATKLPAGSTTARGSVASPGVIKVTRNSTGRSRVTVPEPFSLATDRRASLSIRPAEQPSVASAKPKAGVVRASFDSPQVPPKPSPKPATSPEPFRLASVKRHEEAQERLKAELRVKAIQEDEKRNFRAQPFHQTPQPQVVKSSPPLVRRASPKLLVDSRADKRKEFAKQTEEKSALKLQEKKSILEKSKAELEEQMKHFRSQLTFKASPMPSFYKKSKEGVAPLLKSKSAPSSPVARKAPAGSSLASAGTEQRTARSSATISAARASSLRKSVEGSSAVMPARTRSETEVKSPTTSRISFSSSFATSTVHTVRRTVAKPSPAPSPPLKPTTVRPSVVSAAAKKAEAAKAEVKKPAASRLSSKASAPSGPARTLPAASTAGGTKPAAGRPTGSAKPPSAVRPSSPVRSSLLRSSSPTKAVPAGRSSSPLKGSSALRSSSAKEATPASAAVGSASGAEA